MLLKPNKNLKGFIQIPILIAIIISVLIVGAGGYFGVKQYQSYQTQKTEKEKLAQESGRLKQDEVEQREKEKQEMEKLKKEVEDLKNQKPQTIVKEIQSPTKNQNTITNNEIDIASLANSWSKISVIVFCEWQQGEANHLTGTSYLQQSGSGTLIKFSDGYKILTNRHVVLDSNGYGASFCGYMNETIGAQEPVYSKDIRISSVAELDWATLSITNPHSSVKNTVDNSVFKVCKNLEKGEKVIVLGYPSIGSGQTITDGIVSSFEGGSSMGFDYFESDYVVTSAKIDSGNSGGTAISVKNNCFIGMPTFGIIGIAESLGRILSARSIGLK